MYNMYMYASNVRVLSQYQHMGLKLPPSLARRGSAPVG